VEEFKERAYERLEKARLYPVLLDKCYSAVWDYRIDGELERVGVRLSRDTLSSSATHTTPYIIKVVFLFIQPIPASQSVSHLISSMTLSA